jgi:predicted dehydrogenase
MVHENWRWQPWYREVARRSGAGVIGTPVTYCFRIRRDDGGGDHPYTAQPYFAQMPRLLIHETLVHPIDTARFLFGEIASIHAHARRRNPVIAGEDQALLLLAHRDGLPGVIDGHRFLDLAPNSPPLGDARFEGESGVLEVSATGDVLLNGAVVWFNREKKGYRGDSVYQTQRHFIDCLRGGLPFETSGRDYLATFAAVEAAYRSIEERRTVDVEALNQSHER